MLERKPRIGEYLIYQSLRDGTKECRVARFVSVDIIEIEYGDGHSSQVIWRFHDGLNGRLSHKPTAVRGSSARGGPSWCEHGYAQGFCPSVGCEHDGSLDFVGVRELPEEEG